MFSSNAFLIHAPAKISSADAQQQYIKRKRKKLYTLHDALQTVPGGNKLNLKSSQEIVLSFKFFKKKIDSKLQKYF